MAFLYHNPEIWQLPNKQSMEKKNAWAKSKDMRMVYISCSMWSPTCLCWRQRFPHLGGTKKSYQIQSSPVRLWISLPCAYFWVLPLSLIIFVRPADYRSNLCCMEIFHHVWQCHTSMFAHLHSLKCDSWPVAISCKYFIEFYPCF